MELAPDVLLFNLMLLSVWLWFGSLFLHVHSVYLLIAVDKHFIHGSILVVLYDQVMYEIFWHGNNANSSS